jgi:hypothetical protein
MRKLKAKLKINPDAKSWERFKDKVQTARLILDSHKSFNANLHEFLTALDEIASPKLRYRVALHSREIAAHARILGNIARRNALEEMRDRRNGRKSQLSPESKKVEQQQERRQKIKEKMLAILKNDPSAEKKAVWRKVFYAYGITNDQKKALGSRNTLEKDFETAWNKLFTPLLEEKPR